MSFLGKRVDAKKEPSPNVTAILSLDECAAFLDEKPAQEFARLLKAVGPRFNEIKAPRPTSRKPRPSSRPPKPPGRRPLWKRSRTSAHSFFSRPA